jgi:hypothetical protein
VTGSWEFLEAAGASGFRWTGDSYHYNAKTDPGWRNTCRVIQLKLIDNSVYALFVEF